MFGKNRLLGGLPGGVGMLLLIPVLFACSSPGDDGAETAAPATGSELGARNFLQFLNRQPELAAGEYQWVAATTNPGASGPFTLNVGLDDGSLQSFEGRWESSGGLDPGDQGNPRFSVTLFAPGGMTAELVAPSNDAYLYLLDRNGNVVAEDDNGGAESDARVVLHDSATDSEIYARAYYAALDPSGDRDTLSKWLSVNGFDEGDDAYAVFRDTQDLGYGRNMHMRHGPDGTAAFYVGNFQIENVPGQEYSAANLDAAVGAFPEFHIGTNAIEYGPVDADQDGVNDDLDGDGNTRADRDDYVVKFYTFDPYPPYARRLSVDLDGLGDRGMPVPCITCHGGRADPLLPDGSFPRNGDTLARLQPIEVDTLEFSSQSGFTQAEMEPGIRAINLAVYNSFAPNSRAEPGRWNSAAAREMLEAWYGGPGLPNENFQGGHVPRGWRPNVQTGFPPAGSEQLYLDLVAVNCRTCHLLRGTQDNSEIDFTSFEKFIGHAAELESLVFDEGRMPLALVPFSLLHDAEGPIDLLASFLPGMVATDEEGSTLIPGRAIADAGPDRTAPSPVAVNGIASRHSVSFQWEIVSQPTGSIATVEDSDKVRAHLNASVDGDYELELIVTGETGDVSSDRVRVRVRNQSRAPKSLRFETDIRPVILENCTSCHRPGGNGEVLPPVFFVPPRPGENRDLYEEIRARVNFDDPTESRILTKPSGRRHAGNLRPGFDLNGNSQRYRLFLDWILEGAVP